MTEHGYKVVVVTVMYVNRISKSHKYVEFVLVYISAKLNLYRQLHTKIMQPQFFQKCSR